jgi:hypothetical protein
VLLWFGCLKRVPQLSGSVLVLLKVGVGGKKWDGRYPRVEVESLMKSVTMSCVKDQKISHCWESYDEDKLELQVGILFNG